jgi:YHS domain-containing protein
MEKKKLRKGGIFMKLSINNRTRFFVLALLAAGFQIGISSAQEPSRISSMKPVQTKHVCMANDKYMGVDQIPVSVEGKTYYGCCAGCAASIKENRRNVRFSKDPLTGETVDKATAYIVAIEGSTKVLYFKSGKTYRRYLRQSRGME